MVDSIEDIKKFINDNSFKKIFILCGNKSFAISGAEKFFQAELKNKEIKFFKKNSEIPILEELIEIIKQIKNFKPNLILAIGGGAIIDYAKIANVVDVRPDLSDLIINYSYPFKEKYTKLAVIPTTAGSGAEVTSNAVIYVDGIKHSFESNLLIPDNFFLIPEFIVSAPDKIKASAGFDAIAQALESLVSKKSNDQSIDYATKSLKISINSYLSFLQDSNIKNAAEMSIAANLAGKAINISKTTAPHAVSYPFTSLFNISHGHAVGLFFEKFFKFDKGWIERKNVKPIDYIEKDFFKKISIFKNIKYKWGGKTYKGIDCSGLVQICLNFNNIYCPRDAKDQLIYFKKNINVKKIKKK